MPRSSTILTGGSTNSGAPPSAAISEAMRPKSGVVEIAVTFGEIARIAEGDEGVVEDRETGKRDKPRDDETRAKRRGCPVEVEPAQEQWRVEAYQRPCRVAHTSTGRKDAPATSVTSAPNTSHDTQ